MNNVNKLMIRIIGIPFIIIIPFSTLLFGLLAALTFGLFGLLTHWIKNVLFIFPTIILSRSYENGGFIGRIISIFGLPFSILGFIVSSLLGHGGDLQLRAYEINLYESFPYSYSFDRYAKKKCELYELEDNAQEVIEGLLYDPKFDTLIDQFRSQFQ